jgi:hypothetical protein
LRKIWKTSVRISDVSDDIRNTGLHNMSPDVWFAFSMARKFINYVLSITTHEDDPIVGSKHVKAISVIGHGDLYICGTSRLPHFVSHRFTNGGENVSLTRRPPFTPRKILVLISVRG